LGNGDNHLDQIVLHLVHGCGKVAEFVVAVYLNFFSRQVACG
jgi:hypothetical protein